MDFNKLIARARNVLTEPKTEWPVIAAEPETVAGLYRNYILVLAAIPAVAGFLKMSVIGTGVPMIGTVRIGIVPGLVNMVLQYGIALGVVYVAALIANALAPTFGAQKQDGPPVQALKAIAYAATAGWVAGALVIVPWFGFFLAIAGAIYGIYLLYLGLPSTMNGPPEKAVGYTAVIVIAHIVLGLVLGGVVARMTGAGAGAGAGRSNTTFEFGSGDNKVTVDLDQMAARMEDAGKRMEEAEKKGDTQAQMKAAGEMMGAMLGGGDVEALSTEQLKPFVPAALGGMARSNFSVERNTVMGIQTAQGRASYANEAGDRTVNLEIVDFGGAKGLTAFAGWAMQQSDRETDTGYEKVYRAGDRMVHEEWDGSTQSGTYGLILANRFSVTLRGSGYPMDDLKKMTESLDLSKLEALKESGAKPG